MNIKTLKSTLFIANCILVLIVPLSYFFSEMLLFELGVWIGRLALIVLWLTLFPGLIKRLKLQGAIKKFGSQVMVLRRNLGVMMFLLSLLHYLWTRGFGYIRWGFPTDPSMIPFYQVMGFNALVFLVPLVLTSNNFSVKYLKKVWHWIHRLVYVSLLLIALHLAFNPGSISLFLSILTFGLLGLEIYSWIKIAYDKISTSQ